MSEQNPFDLSCVRYSLSEKECVRRSFHRKRFKPPADRNEVNSVARITDEKSVYEW